MDEVKEILYNESDIFIDRLFEIEEHIKKLIAEMEINLNNDNNEENFDNESESFFDAYFDFHFI